MLNETMQKSDKISDTSFDLENINLQPSDISFCGSLVYCVTFLQL